MERYLFAAIACSVAAVVILGVLLVRQWRITHPLRRRIKELGESLRLRDEELKHLADTRLPELVDYLNDRPVSVSGPLNGQKLQGTPYEHSVRSVMDLFAHSVGQAQNRADESDKATLRTMMRTVQSLANEQQFAISTMQDRHDDPDVLEDLLKIDHMNAQIARRAQATAVLCGSWPGQQRSASALTDVARGATSRIRDYLRVKIHSQVNVAVVSRAVEPVVLVLAELLDNAARYSQPNTSVEVNFQTTHNGVAIVIDDAGVAMDAEELQQAARLLSGSHRIHINKLGNPPQIGFAVCGVLAAQYGFSVSVDTRSPYGGVRAVVFVPAALLTRTAPPAAEPGAMVHTAAIQPPPHFADGSRTNAAAQTPGGLPKRRRMALPAQPQPVPSAQVIDRRDRPAQEIAAGMGAWQRGSRSGRASGPYDRDTVPPYNRVPTTYDRGPGTPYDGNGAAYGNDNTAAYEQDSTAPYDRNNSVPYDRDAAQYDHDTRPYSRENAAPYGRDTRAYDRDSTATHDRDAAAPYEGDSATTYDRDQSSYGRDSATYDNSAGTTTYDSSGSTDYDGSGATAYESDGGTTYDSAGGAPYEREDATSYERDSATAYGRDSAGAFDRDAVSTYDHDAAAPYDADAVTPYEREGKDMRP
jgi:signal transduction histidine kinase